jgi:hypothetical protein
MIARLRRKGRPTSAWPSSGPTSPTAPADCVAISSDSEARAMAVVSTVRVAWSSSTRASSSTRERWVSTFSWYSDQPSHAITATISKAASAPSQGTARLAFQKAAGRRDSGAGAVTVDTVPVQPAQGCSTTIGARP